MKIAIKEALSLLIASAVYGLILYAGVPENLGTVVRYSLYFPPASAVFLFLSYRNRGFFGNTGGLTLTLALFAMPIARLWSTGASDSYIMGGLLPWSDASTYYAAAHALLEGQKMVVQRPLFSGMLASLLALTGQNLQMTLALLGAISGIAFFYAGREIRQTYGAFAAAFVVCALFLFARVFLGQTMTEIMGLALGALGFAILIRAMRFQKAATALLGLCIVSTALNMRMAAFFVLPALLAWSVFLFGKSTRLRWRFAALGIIAILLPFAASFLLYKIHCIPNSDPPFSNYSVRLYGLLTGGDWQKVYTDHPEISQIEYPKRFQRIWEIDLLLLRKNPAALFKGIFRTSQQYFFGRRAGFFPNLPLKIEYALRALTLLGFLVTCISIRRPSSSLLFAAFLGNVFSVGFVSVVDAGAKPFAATNVILYLLAATALVTLGQYVTRIALLEAIQQSRWKKSVLLLMPFLTLFTYPFWSRNLIVKTEPVEIRMAASGCEYIRVYWDDPNRDPNSFERLPVNPQSSRIWNVRVESLHPEIRLKQVSTPEEYFDWTKAHSDGPPWEFVENFANGSDQIAIARAAAPQRLDMQIHGRDLTIQFLTTPRGGLARLTVNGKTEVVDFFGSGRVHTLFFPGVASGDGTVRNYKMLLPASSWRHLKIEPEGPGTVRVQSVRADGRTVMNQGDLYRLPYRFINRQNYALAATTFTLIFTALLLYGTFAKGGDIRSDDLYSISPASVFLAFSLTSFCLLGPFLTGFSYRTKSLRPDCPPGLQSEIFSFSRGSYLHLIPDDAAPSTRLSDVRLSDFRRGLISFNPWAYDNRWLLMHQKASMTIVDAGHPYWLIADSNQVPAKSGKLAACGTVETFGSVSVFHADSLRVLNGEAE